MGFRIFIFSTSSPFSTNMQKVLLIFSILKEYYEFSASIILLGSPMPRHFTTSSNSLASVTCTLSIICSNYTCVLPFSIIAPLTLGRAAPFPATRVPRRIMASSSSNLSKCSRGNKTALSIATGKPRCLPRIITAHRTSLLSVRHPPENDDDVSGIPTLIPTVAYADTHSNTTLKTE